MNNKFEEWWKKSGQFLKCDNWPNQDIIEKVKYKVAWDAAIESTKENRFGCHIAAHRGDKIFIYAFCMHDAGYDCTWSTSKTDCEYWREIEE